MSKRYCKQINFSITTVLAVLCLSASLQAKTFEREYTYRASEADSKITARSIALNQVKTALLEEIGVYIESTFDDKSAEKNTGLEQLSQQQIVSITAGVTETKILDEKWDGQTYYMKAQITVDIADVKKKIAEIAKDRDKTKELEEVKQKADAAYKQIQNLQSQLVKTWDDNVKLKLQADYQKNSDNLSVADWSQMGYNALDSNDYDKAILYFQKTIGSSSGVLLFKDIDDFFGYLNIGLAYYMKENYDKSIEMLEKAVQLNTKYEKAYSLLGCAYAGNGNYDKAIEVFDKAIQISPEDANLNYNIGYAYRKTGYLVKATKYYKQAANLGQKDAQEYLKLHGVEWK